MIKASWMVLLTTCSLWSAAGCADDVLSSKTDGELLSKTTRSVESMLVESEYPSRWRPFHPTTATVYSSKPLRPVADFDILDADALSRVSKLRGLSLLTLADFGQTRLFLGVNEEGLVGLHFNAFPRYGAQSYPEMIRMPYLRNPSRAAK